MIFKTPKLDAKARYDTYKSNNRLHHYTAVNAVKYGFRLIKRGVSCGIIVPDMSGVATLMAAIVAGEHTEGFNVIKERDDGFDFEDGVQIRIIPRTNESIAALMLGRDDGKTIKIIQAKEGDPQLQKFNDLMGFD